MMVLLALFLLQFSSFLAATVDIRAIAMRKYRWALVTNFLIPVFNYFTVKFIGDSNTFLGAVAMGCGGAISAIVGIWLTWHWSHDDGSRAA